MLQFLLDWCTLCGRWFLCICVGELPTVCFFLPFTLCVLQCYSHTGTKTGANKCTELTGTKNHQINSLKDPTGGFTVYDGQALDNTDVNTANFTRSPPGL